MYLTYHLADAANTSKCVRALARAQDKADEISRNEPPAELLFGFGFGDVFLAKIHPSAARSGVTPFRYNRRSCSVGEMPATGGDIFIHIKCDDEGKLFDMARTINCEMPSKAVAKRDETWGWVYRGGRDLSGFVDGTANAKTIDDRIENAVNKKTQGSYVLTQKWIHKHDAIDKETDEVLTNWIGRTRKDDVGLDPKPVTSHVHRMISSRDAAGRKIHQVYRQSMPWGTATGDSGLFFIAYSATIETLDWMLDRMTGDSDDKKSDDVFRMTQVITGTYWYFPNKTELKEIFSSTKASSRAHK